jgi:hypothetical protein
MRTPLALLAPLIATLFLAGCVAGPTSQNASEPSTEAWQPTPDPAEPSASEEPAPTPAASSKPQPAMSGQTTQTATQNITLDGRTPTRTCMGVNQGCREIEPGHNTTLEIDTYGAAYLNGTLTWDATPGVTDRLYIVLVYGNDHYYLNRREGSWARSGDSPLEVSFDLSRSHGQPLKLVVHDNYCLAHRLPVATCALDGSFNYSVGQDFHFEGQLTAAA